MPFVQVCGVNQRFRARASSPTRPGRGHPGREDDVGLVDVEGIGLEGREQLVERARHLAAGDPHAGAEARRRRQSAQVRAGERLLEPQDVVLREARRRSPRASTGSSEAGRVAGHPPGLVQVDHDRHRIADRVAGRGDRREALVQPPRVDPDLQRPEPLLAQARARIRLALRGGRSIPHEA